MQYAVYCIVYNMAVRYCNTVTSERAQDFRYTNRGNCVTIDNVDDSDQFYEMSESMFNLGITEEQQLFMYSVLAAVLHMGNIRFVEERNDSCSIPVS